MATQNRPSSPRNAPDPATSYGREKPEKEAGMGRLDNNDDAVPTERQDTAEKAVANRQNPARAEESEGVKREDKVAPKGDQQPDHSMLDEEPLGWDQAPIEKKPKEDQRQPRTRGNGGIAE